MANTEKAPKKETPAALKKSQLAPSFLPSELAHIREAQYVKRQLKGTDLARTAVLEYIKDVPKTQEVIDLEAAEAEARAAE